MIPDYVLQQRRDPYLVGMDGSLHTRCRAEVEAMRENRDAVLDLVWCVHALIVLCAGVLHLTFVCFLVCL